MVDIFYDFWSFYFRHRLGTVFWSGLLASILIVNSQGSVAWKIMFSLVMILNVWFSATMDNSKWV